MTDLAIGRDHWLGARYAADARDGQDDGRHALDEEAILTPIFHALTRSGWTDRQREQAPVRSVDPVDDFRRDPLTAPIPVQALSSMPVQPRSRSEDSGRHRRRLESAWNRY